jgi:DNA-binding NtrC family response regulator
MTDDAVTRTIQFEGVVDTLSLRKYWIRPSTGAEQCIENRLIYLGTSPDNHVVMDNPTVSRVHCKIEADAKGHRIRDLESKNGTFINNVRVNDAYLPSECSVRVGDAEFSFSLTDENVEVQLTRHNQFGDLLGESLQMREVFGLLSRVAPTNATVLVEGQSGTGKELVADALHRESPRRDKRLVVFDCSAVPRDLVESELFGHIKGAFTGATANRSGAFEEAHGGTLFLDEIGELPLDLQPRLLRVLEKREVKPVGSNEVRPVDVRIVAATNRNLSMEVKEGNFREDLYYRLAVIRIQLPPLHKRVEDIPLLVNHFVGLAQDQLGLQSQAFEINFETMTKLQRYQWPGNVRELKNFIERAALLAGDGPIDTKFIGGESNLNPSSSPAPSDSSSAPGGEALSAEYSLPFKDAKSRLIEQFEYTYWSRLLNETKGNVSEAARQGGIHRKSLEYLLKKIDLAAKDLSNDS